MDSIDYCIICGDVIDYCQGHGEAGADLWEDHDYGDHERCHPSAGCLVID